MGEKPIQSSLQERIFSEIKAYDSCSLRVFHQLRRATKDHGKETHCVVFTLFEWKLHLIFSIAKLIQ